MTAVSRAFSSPEALDVSFKLLPDSFALTFYQAYVHAIDTGERETTQKETKLDGNHSCVCTCMYIYV